MNKLKKILGIILFIIGLFFIITEILFTLSSLFNSNLFKINNLLTIIILNGISLISILGSLKLLDNTNWKLTISIILIIFGILYFVPVIISSFYTNINFHKDIIISLSIVSILLLLSGITLLIQQKKLNLLQK
ncbi:hypothetical protein SAMN02744040_02336 [Tepidibacter thalassicus DSM 15285]|uniref:Uncharacterized protein n=1 Tax=Tepidibacter thalassicus DSM 15285 TaxID=1123350 RepID=A0A1M5TXY6_9FIRM|nr:hypothetical protein SAMN02744040_02336 [Tepidibacter thalassicus DSM 15285]